MYAEPAPQNTMEDKLEQLKQLGQLKEQGVLTDAEFAVQKDRILNSTGLARLLGQEPEGAGPCTACRRLTTPSLR